MCVHTQQPYLKKLFKRELILGNSVFLMHTFFRTDLGLVSKRSLSTHQKKREFKVHLICNFPSLLCLNMIEVLFKSRVILGLEMLTDCKSQFAIHSIASVVRIPY